MRISGSQIDELVSNRIGTNKLRTTDNRQDPDFLETVGLSTIVCRPNLPKFMEEDQIGLLYIRGPLGSNKVLIIIIECIDLMNHEDSL